MGRWPPGWPDRKVSWCQRCGADTRQHKVKGDLSYVCQSCKERERNQERTGNAAARRAEKRRNDRLAELNKAVDEQDRDRDRGD